MARTTALTISQIILFFFLLTLFTSSFSTACNENDKKALLAFKNSFHYTSLGRWWSESTDCCSWSFVSCDTTSGRVTSLDFTNDYDFPEYIFLNGSIPASIGDFSALERLSFQRLTSLKGPIPPQLANLKNLQSLNIYQTQISGPLPSFLSQLSSLQQLTIGYSKLSGPIPSSLGNLQSLTEITLYGNRLTGRIPGSLFSKIPISSLAVLILSNNKLTGPIPTSFANVAFSALALPNNKLVGDPSFLFGKSKAINYIDLGNNKLAFDFGKVEFPVGTTSIDVSRNEIYGRIPEQIAELSSLSAFDVSYNYLCGKIPSGLAFGNESYAHNKCLCDSPLEPCEEGEMQLRTAA